MRQMIETAPRDGKFIIIADDASGRYDVVHWSPAGEWVRENGEPSEVTPSRWHPVPSETYHAPGDEGSSSVPAASPVTVAPVEAQMARVQAKRAPDGRRGFATSIAVTLVAVALIGMYLHAEATVLLTRYPGLQNIFGEQIQLAGQELRKANLLAHQPQAEPDQAGAQAASSDNSAADLKREFSRERDRASVAIGGLTAAPERENVALTEALESKRIANSKQKEFKQTLDESEKRTPALKSELTSAHETVASAEKPSNAEVSARDAAAPTGPLNRPMEQSNVASEIAGSMTTPQSRGNVTAGVQDATPDDATTDASGRLTRSTRSEPGRPQPPNAMSPAEEAKLVARAESLIKQLDFIGARLLLAYTLEKGSARAAFMMAETYDRQILRSLQAYGVRGDAQMARKFYQLAAAAGIEKARERVEALQSDANADTRVGAEKHSR
jgi:hypothetical protein